MVRVPATTEAKQPEVVHFGYKDAKAAKAMDTLAEVSDESENLVCDCCG